MVLLVVHYSWVNSLVDNKDRSFACSHIEAGFEAGYSNVGTDYIFVVAAEDNSDTVCTVAVVGYNFANNYTALGVVVEGTVAEAGCN